MAWLVNHHRELSCPQHLPMVRASGPEPLCCQGSPAFTPSRFWPGLQGGSLLEQRVAPGVDFLAALRVLSAGSGEEGAGA